ncbi:MAG TPA: glycoside hydrolase family 2, partial [Lachnoclostridium sp.]|nr:glycoside hydrolase family 2 [Lachnoclostridium sp.]
VYASQLMQGEAMKYAVEHWRRHRGRCMGAIVWQLNDCWPVTSWSSIDYFGRWKALHYYEKRFFAPIMISCEEEGQLSQNPNINTRPYPLKKSFRLNVANETLNEQLVKVRYSLRNAKSEIIGKEMIVER